MKIVKAEILMSINFNKSLGIFLICGLISLQLHAQTSAFLQDSKIKTIEKAKLIIKKIKQDDIYETMVDFIKKSRPNRLVGSTGNLKARQFVIDYINKEKGKDDLIWLDEFTPDIESAIQMYEQDFQTLITPNFPPHTKEFKDARKLTDSTINTLKSFKGMLGKNIIFEKKGKTRPDEMILLGAHLDTIKVDSTNQTLAKEGSMPGADNNATGVCLLLNLIKLISKLELDKTVRVVFFDFETLGFLGSKAFVSKYQEELKGEKKKVVGFINLLMLGHDTKDQDQLKQNGNMVFYLRPSNSEDKALLQIVNVQGALSIPGIKFSEVEKNFTDGSNSSFWDKNIPALAMTSDWDNDPNLKIHTPNDAIESLNMNTLYGAYQHISLAILAWAFDIKK